MFLAHNGHIEGADPTMTLVTVFPWLYRWLIMTPGGSWDGRTHVSPGTLRGWETRKGLCPSCSVTDFSIDSFGLPQCFTLLCNRNFFFCLLFPSRFYTQAGRSCHCILALHQSDKFILGITRKSTKWIFTSWEAIISVHVPHLVSGTLQHNEYQSYFSHLCDHMSLIKIFKKGFILSCSLWRDTDHHCKEDMTAGAWSGWSHCISIQELEVKMVCKASRSTPTDLLLPWKV